MRALLLGLCLLAGNAWGADRYIDPACAHNGNGEAQACAASDGGAGARNTYASITWGGHTWHQRGGTTWTATAALFVNAANAQVKSGDLIGWGDGPASIDCSGYDGGTYCIRPAADAVQVLGMRVIGCGAGATCKDTVQVSTSATNFVLDGSELIGLGDTSTITDTRAVAVLAAICPITITDNTMSAYARNITFPSPGGACAGASTIARNRIGPNSDNSPSDSDGVGFLGSTIWAFGGGMVVANNVITGFHENGIDLAAASGVVVSGNTITNPIKQADSVTPTFILAGNVSATGGGTSHLAQNFLLDDDAGDDPDGASVGIGFRGSWNASNVYSNIVVGVRGYCMFASNGGGAYVPTGNAVANNTFSECDDGAVRLTHGTTWAFANNVNNAMSMAIVSDVGTTGTYSHAISSSAMTATFGGTWTSANPTTTDPQFLGGTSPTTAEGFRPNAGSPLIRAGTPTAAKYDYRGRRFNTPPSIGAYELPAVTAPDALYSPASYP